MKAKLVLILTFLQIAIFASAEITVEKSMLIQPQSGFFNVNVSFAQNSLNGDTFIVWQKSNGNGRDGSILGCIVNANGKIITPIMTLAKRPGIGSPTIAYDPIKDEYVVVYDSSFFGPKSELFAKRLSSNGKQRGKEMQLQTDPISEEASDLAPKISYNIATNNYAIAWLRDDDDNGEQNGVFAGTYTSNLTKNGSAILIRKSLEWPKFPVARDMAFLPGGEKLLIIMRQISEGVSETAVADYHLATTDASIRKITHRKKLNKNPVARDTGWSAIVEFSSRQLGMLFYAENDGIKFRQIDSQGKATGTARAAFQSPKANATLSTPAVAFSTKANGPSGLLVASELNNSGSTSWAQVLDPTAKPIGAPVLIDEAATDETIGFAILFALPLKPNETALRFEGYEISRQTSGTREISSGIKRLKITLTQ